MGVEIAAVGGIGLVMLALAWLLVLASCAGAARQWRSPRYPPGSPYSRHERDDLRRRLPAAAVGLTFLVLAVTIDAIWGHRDAGAKIAIVAAAAIGVVAFLVTLSTMYLHRPAWAIPPYLRDRPRERR